MTVIRIDAATLAKIGAAGAGPIYLADETGKPVLELATVTPVQNPDDEPQLSADERRAILNSPAKYKLDQAWEKIRRGEKF
jgi:hypothetical protein